MISIPSPSGIDEQKPTLTQAAVGACNRTRGTLVSLRLVLRTRVVRVFLHRHQYIIITLQTGTTAFRIAINTSAEDADQRWRTSALFMRKRTGLALARTLALIHLLLASTSAHRTRRRLGGIGSTNAVGKTHRTPSSVLIHNDHHRKILKFDEQFAHNRTRSQASPHAEGFQQCSSSRLHHRCRCSRESRVATEKTISQ